MRHRSGIVLSLAEGERVDFPLASSIVTLPELAVSAATDILSGFLFQHAPC